MFMNAATNGHLSAGRGSWRTTARCASDRVPCITMASGQPSGRGECCAPTRLTWTSSCSVSIAAPRIAAGCSSTELWSLPPTMNRCATMILSLLDTQRLFRPISRECADIRLAWSGLRRAALGGKSLTPVKWIPQSQLSLRPDRSLLACRQGDSVSTGPFAQGFYRGGQPPHPAGDLAAHPG